MRARLARWSSQFLTDIYTIKSFKRCISSQATSAMDYSATLTTGQLGTITLQRGKALNAINLGGK
jgi:hypothetical protein